MRFQLQQKEKFVIVGLDIPEMLAQAGGGGNYGSSRGGGGSGGDGGDLIYLAFQLIRLTIHAPHIGIPIWVVLGVGFYFSQRAGRDYHVTRTIRRGRKFQEDGLRHSSLGLIQQRDPVFEMETFLQRASNAFVTTQRAWSEQDLRLCRAFISDGVRERFELYIAMQKAENIRNRMNDVEIKRKEVVSITTDEHFDTIHVRITAAAISYDEDLKSGRRVGGRSSRAPIQFTEIWSFSRRPGVATNPDHSLLQGQCPNCGGPVAIVDKAECPQCQSTVNSGQFDWVLAEITQDEEWVVPPVQHSVSGWEKLQSADPGLNFQHIEDRASVMFWRSMMAVYFDNADYARPILAETCTAIPDIWAPAGCFWKTPAVGVVEVTDCLPDRGDGFDRLAVLVRWSATKAKGDRRKPVLLGRQKIYSHSMTLKRKQGASSNADLAFASSSCGGCGAPIDATATSTCQFCGSSLNDGVHDWVLESVDQHGMIADLRREDRRDHQIQAQGGVERLESDRFQNEPELLTALARLLVVDGELHQKEKQHLLDFAERRNVPKERLKAIFTTAQAKEIPIRLPQNRKQANVFMDHLLRAALVDGKVTRTEFGLLLQTSEQVGWTPVDLKHSLARTRKELFQQAKQIIRDRRKTQTVS